MVNDNYEHEGEAPGPGGSLIGLLVGLLVGTGLGLYRLLREAKRLGP